MRPPVSRAVRWAGALALAVIVAVAVFGPGGGDDTPSAAAAPVVAQTEFGPLSPADVDLLVKVRQAGLWEIPTGQQMQQRASRDVVAEVGRLLATEHTELDGITRRTADQLSVTLPSQPSAQQQTWMDQITAASGADYDRTAITLLRLAHGNVLPVVAQVRSGTRNDLVREFATTAATFVTRHHEYLESTGMVDFAALPQPGAPAGSPPSPPPGVPQLAANNGLAPGDADGFGAVVAAIRDASLSSYFAAAVAFAAVLGAAAMLDMVVVRNRTRPGPRGPAPSHPARGYPAPFPGPPPPPRSPYGAQQQVRAPRRAPGPAALAILVVAALALPPILTSTADDTPPASPSRTAALAAGFAQLEPPPDHVLAFAAASRISSDDDENETDENDQGRDDQGSEDNERDNDNNDAGNDDGGDQDNEQDNDQNNDQNNEQGNNGNNDQDEDQQDEDAGQDDAEDFPGREDAAPPGRDDFVDIGDVTDVLDQPAGGGDASTGSYVAQCGTPEPSLRNSDNWIVAPGKVNGAQHMHDYVGSVVTDAFTSAGDLLESRTTCPFDDSSTFFWPVLRDTTGNGSDEDDDGGGLDGNVGEILEPAQVVLQFVGNADGPVEPMPQLLRVITGDAKAVTNGDENVRAQWSCRGFEDRASTEYPLCPGQSRLLRVLDFPSCWDGESLDSEDHRSHMAFPDERSGECPDDTVAVPQLRMILAYDQPAGRTFALDSFPDQQHDPATDHGDFVNGMPPGLMAEVVECINEGLQC